ncbi:hypothetical protein PT974_09214 [Cladobotryum mycophilum]|uniref:Uncharacterized protein n=1 Tax=Cladobotryum mycophilum TaxID=491253 RepID=A0ABR0SFL6_9HYPO
MHLILDFDGTITVKDTVGELAQAAIAFQKHHRGIDLQGQWDKVVQDYLKDLKSYNARYSPPEGDRQDISEELCYLSGLDGIENASLDRVERSGAFSGLKRENLFEMGVDKITRGSIVIREGLDEMLQLASQQEWTVDIISVNWSKAFIEGVLHNFRHYSISVLANEVTEAGKINGPQFLGRRLTTSLDKAACLAHQVAGYSGTTIYFGDSTTDLECLLHQRGIVIAADEKSSLMQTLCRIGIPVPHACDSHGGGNCSGPETSKRFYRTIY